MKKYSYLTKEYIQEVAQRVEAKTYAKIWAEVKLKYPETKYDVVKKIAKLIEADGYTFDGRNGPKIKGNNKPVETSEPKTEKRWMQDLLKEKQLVKATPKFLRELEEAGWTKHKDTNSFPHRVYFERKEA